MFNNKHGIALIHKSVQNSKEHVYILEMQSGSRFVKNK